MTELSRADLIARGETAKQPIRLQAWNRTGLYLLQIRSILRLVSRRV